MKPPLNVYFSGYRTAEGFEGYYMMKRMNAPFYLSAILVLKVVAFISVHLNMNKVLSMLLTRH